MNVVPKTKKKKGKKTISYNDEEIFLINYFFKNKRQP